MPQRARPYALGLLQALSTVGNVTAALISVGLGRMEETGVLGDWQLFGFSITAWRAMFLVGTLPALLAIVIRWRLKEPEQWKDAAAQTDAKHKLGSYSELFGDPRWRHRAIVGLLLATSGVIGLWGIGFFSIDLNRSVLRKVFEQELRDAGEVDQDRDYLRYLLRNPADLAELTSRVKPIDLVNSDAERTDAQPLLTALLDLEAAGETISLDTVLAALDAKGQSADERARRAEYLDGEPTDNDGQQLAAAIAARSKTLNGRLSKWIGYMSMMLNIGGFFGIYSFSIVTQRIGRRPTFAVAFLAAAASTLLVFWKMDGVSDIFWMVPLMGFCQLSLFGGYAIYFPELFPTRLRSTGTSFCYNVGRFVAALGPSALGLLTSKVFVDSPEPMRYAGMTMCCVFAIGLLTLPFAPETKDQPLPE
jgi:MFS family permease